MSTTPINLDSNTRLEYMDKGAKARANNEPRIPPLNEALAYWWYKGYDHPHLPIGPSKTVY